MRFFYFSFLAVILVTASLPALAEDDCEKALDDWKAYCSKATCDDEENRILSACVEIAGGPNSCSWIGKHFLNIEEEQCKKECVQAGELAYKECTKRRTGIASQPQASKPAGTPVLTKECKSYCKDNVLYNNGRFDEPSGGCSYLLQHCEVSCDPNTLTCVQSQLKLTQIVFDQPSRGLILNGSDHFTISGTAEFENPLNEPIEGKHIILQATGITGEAQADSDKLWGAGVIDAILKADKTFTSSIYSNRKLAKIPDLDSAKLRISAKEKPDVSMDVELLSPAPRITGFHLTGEPAVWQDSYGVLEVSAEDADNNIDHYTITAPMGTLRLYHTDWEGEKIKEIPASVLEKPGEFKFGWKAPAVSAKLVADVLGRIGETVKDDTRALLNQPLQMIMHKGFNLNKDQLAYVPGADVISNISREKKDGKYGISTDSSQEYKLRGATYEVLKYGIGPQPVLSKAVLERLKGYGLDRYKDIGVADAVATAELAAQTAYHAGGQYEQASQALAQGNEYSHEEAGVRGVSIALDGVRMFVAGVAIYAKTQNGSETAGMVVDFGANAAHITLKSIQAGAEYMGDVYSAAGAKIKGLPFLIGIEVFDKDGYSDKKVLLFEVQGYEKVMAY
jgi:hypothetical protein